MLPSQAVLKRLRLRKSCTTNLHDRKQSAVQKYWAESNIVDRSCQLIPRNISRKMLIQWEISSSKTGEKGNFLGGRRRKKEAMLPVTWAFVFSPDIWICLWKREKSMGSLCYIGQWKLVKRVPLKDLWNHSEQENRCMFPDQQPSSWFCSRVSSSCVLTLLDQCCHGLTPTDFIKFRRHTDTGK